MIRTFAQEEEQSGFDASATTTNAGLSGKSNSGAEHEDSVSTRSHADWTTTDGTSATDETGASVEVLRDLEGLIFDDAGRSGTGTPSTESSGLDTLDNEGKQKALKSIFPQLKAFDIQWTLNKCKYDAGKAIDELMTQSFLEESGTRQRGVEAFTGEDIGAKKKKGKRKGRAKENGLDTDHAEGETGDAKQISQWDRGKKDIEFLCQMTGMPAQQVGSLYHEHRASIKATIRSLIDRHLEIGLEDDDDAVSQLHAHQMKADFPTLSTSDLTALMQITYPSLINAASLARALTAHEMTNKKGGIKIEFRHTPPDLSSDESSIPRTPSKPLPSNLDHIGASASAQSLHNARRQASEQAQAAFRKSRSSPLYGGAASYYSQISRDYADRAKTMTSAAADALVSSQSTRTQLDLHGVNVKDAVRISRERVTEWWIRESEERLRSGRRGGEGLGGGYKIVTGVGRHSEGGKGKIGPAVGRMLISEGWKVEVGSGAIVVRGVVRR